MSWRRIGRVVLLLAVGAWFQLMFDEYMYPRHPAMYCPNFFAPPEWCPHAGDQ